MRRLGGSNDPVEERAEARPQGGLRGEARLALRHERAHLVPGLHDLHRMLGRGAIEVSGEGARVELSDGRSVLDFGSYAVTLLGHRHPAVVDAVRAALERLPTSTRLLPNGPTPRLAHRLVETVDAARLVRVVLGLNGSDVVEAALKLAIAATGRTQLLAVTNGFHGKTLGALAVTHDEQRRAPLMALLGHVRFVEPVDDAVERALQETEAAALIFEPIQGEGGGRALDPGLLRRWCADAHRHGAFVIADEIQCGLRRCGPMSVAHHHSLDVDALLFGKPLGGGVVPLSALVCTDDLYRPLVDDPFFHTATFAGHPLSSAAGLAALDVLEASGPEVDELAPVLSAGLTQLRTDHPDVVGGSDSSGLFGVLRLVSADIAQLLLVEAARRGLLLAPCLTAPDTLRVLPPLVVAPSELEQAGDLLDEACRAVERRAVG